MINGDSGFDNKEFTATPYLKLIENKDGATCLCYQMRLHGKLHFVKKIKPEFENDPRMRAAFRKENEIGFSLSHPNIPRYVFMEGIFSPEEYVVTEWIEGTPLDNFIENNPSYFSDRKNIERFINQLTDAIDYLHQNGIIHGDLKPSNILMSHNGKKAFIIDLGYAVSDAHKLTGGFSYSFASPEVLRGEVPDLYDDYYSFGKILDYIRQNIESIYFSFKIRKQIDNLIAGNPRKKESAYNRLKNSKSEFRRFFIPAIILIILFVNLAWFVWRPYNENKEEEISYNTSQDKGIRNQTEIIEEDNDKELIDGTIVPKIDLTEKNDNSNYHQNAEESIDQKTNLPEIKDKVNKEENLGPDSQVTQGYQSTPIDAELEESVKAEVRRLLNSYYPPVIAKLDYLLKNEIYTKEWQDSIARLYDKGIVRCLNILDYEKKFPSVSRADLFEIVGDESQKFFNENLDKKYILYHEKVKEAGREELVKNL